MQTSQYRSTKIGAGFRQWYVFQGLFALLLLLLLFSFYIEIGSLFKSKLQIDGARFYATGKVYPNIHTHGYFINVISVEFLCDSLITFHAAGPRRITTRSKQWDVAFLIHLCRRDFSTIYFIPCPAMLSRCKCPKFPTKNFISAAIVSTTVRQKFGRAFNSVNNPKLTLTFDWRVWSSIKDLFRGNKTWNRLISYFILFLTISYDWKHSS